MKISFKLPDSRLNDRAKKSFEIICKKPGKPLPEVFKNYSDLEGFYRLMNNNKVNTYNLLDSICGHTFNCLEKEKEFFIIHDTTTVNPAVNKKSKDFGQKGILLHTSLAVSSSVTPQVYGLANLKMWMRDEKNKKVDSENEHLRWFESVNLVEQGLDYGKAIHLMDREGDAYSLLTELIDSNYRFIIRVCHDRLITKGNSSKLFDELRNIAPLFSYEIAISKRGDSPLAKQAHTHPSREKRKLMLNCSSKTIVIQRGGRTDKKYPLELEINFIRLWEQNPPPTEKGVEWILATTEPIDKEIEIRKIIDGYRRRWVIEEFFKGLKTGCNLESKQFESIEVWNKLIIFYIAIATSILNLKAFSSLKMTEIKTGLTSTQVKILKKLAEEKNKKLETAEDYSYELANLGGHIKYNGPPGWIVLLRGMQELITMETGWNMRSNM